jgi:hypothetical protein
LHGLGVDDSSADIVFGIGVDSLQQGEAKSNQFGLNLSVVHRLIGLEDLLGFLTRPASLEDAEGLIV